MALVDEGYAALADIRLALTAGEEVGCHVFLNARPSRARRETWYRVSLERTLADRFAEVARQSLWEIEVSATDEQSLSEFDFDAMVEGGVGVLIIKDTPGLEDWLAGLPQPDWPHVFDGDEDVLKRSRFFAYRLSLPDGREVRAFRGRSGLDVAARKRHAVAAMFHRDAREMVAIEGSVITFDPTPDFFEWDGLLFILNMRTFESVTNIRDITVRKAIDAMDALAGRFTLENIDALKECIGKRTRLVKRLASAHRHGLVGDLDPERLAQLIERRKLQLQCMPHGDRIRFEIDHSNNRAVEDFVDLVADVFLVSPATSRDWEAVVKRLPRRR